MRNEKSKMRTKIETMLNNLKTESDSNLNGILQSVKEVSEVMENIKVASQEQAEGVDQINKAIADMDRITQENSSLVEQNTTASQHMAEEAEHLQDLLNTFKVENNDALSLENKNENKYGSHSNKYLFKYTYRTSWSGTYTLDFPR